LQNKNTHKNISIDGPAASGKTTLGEELALRINYKFLDTGLMYRFVAFRSLLDGIDVNNEKAIVDISNNIDISSFDLQKGEVYSEGKKVTALLKKRNIDTSVSLIAKYSKVRKILVNHQRQIALNNNLVMVGRDIGTVVLPEADHKFFITATPEIRAKRRFKDLLFLNDLSYEEILYDIKKRDSIDISRDDSPLIPAKDAIVIDTSEMSFDISVIEIMKFLEVI